jgi:CpXC protein
MSIFQETAVACPMCGSELEFELVQSVSADRRPELREAILDGSFQRKACPSCGKRLRVEPELVYMDFQRGQYLGAWPATRRHEWKALAAQTRKTFDDALGKNAPASARKLGQGMQLRAVFGWWALAEKILARQLGIDDCTLEAAKLAVMRTQDESPLPGDSELRLLREQDGDLIFAWVGSHGGSDEQPPQMRVPRQLIGDIEAAPDQWQALRDSVTEGDVVDFQREMLVG